MVILALLRAVQPLADGATARVGIGSAEGIVAAFADEFRKRSSAWADT